MSTCTLFNGLTVNCQDTTLTRAENFDSRIYSDYTSEMTSCFSCHSLNSEFFYKQKSRCP